MAKSSPAVAGPRRELIVRFLNPGPNLEGMAASYIRTDKVGRHHAYTIIETALGVEFEKDGVAGFVPWTRVTQVERSDG